MWHEGLCKKSKILPSYLCPAKKSHITKRFFCILSEDAVACFNRIRSEEARGSDEGYEDSHTADDLAIIAIATPAGQQLDLANWFPIVKSTLVTISLHLKPSPSLRVCVQGKNIPTAGSLFCISISKKAHQAQLLSRKLFFLLNSLSCLSLGNKVAIYKTAIKPVSTDGTLRLRSQLKCWDTRRVPDENLRLITGAPRSVSNCVLRRKFKKRAGKIL